MLLFTRSAGKNVTLGLFLLFSLAFAPRLPAGPLPGGEEEAPLIDGPSGAEPLADDGEFAFEAPPLVLEVPGFESRSFNDIFPGLSLGQKSIAMNGRGLRHSFEKDGFPALVPNPYSGINLLDGVAAKKPSHIIEALIVVPYNSRELDFLDIYNALRKIKNIQNHTVSVRGNEVKVFADTTRLESAQKRRPVPDPPPSGTLPCSETMYLRFVDQYMGDLYIRGEVSIGLYGITYSLSNFRDVSYSIFRIMKAESFSAVIYLEPVKEGILVYSVSGFYIPGFIARRVNLTPSMNNRITVLVNWITEGLREEENNIQRGHFYRQ